MKRTLSACMFVSVLPSHRSHSQPKAKPDADAKTKERKTGESQYFKPDPSAKSSVTVEASGASTTKR
jgi:hypothetical protein